jgi:hypothetical protein
VPSLEVVTRKAHRLLRNGRLTPKLSAGQASEAPPLDGQLE